MIKKLLTQSLPLVACAALISPLTGEAAGRKTPPYKAHPDAPKPYGATPTDHQVYWQRLEYYAFVHFSLNTFTNREWGYGDENPAIFNPDKFDANAIIGTFKEAGMTGMIYTAKHHDGWCAWPTESTEHSIKKSPYKDGKGDVVMEFAKACQKAGIHFGTYLSPWDRNHAEYGRPGYIESYYKQIEELLTNYGPIFEIWFDGARGGGGYYGGARDSRDIGNAEDYYNFAQIVKNIRAIQPQTIIWGAGHYGDARWGGSEKGHVGYPHWHTLDSQRGGGGAHGFRNGDRWVPAEGDTPINHAGWFWHPGQETHVKPPEELLQVWFDCVGRGANLILNVAPNRSGQLDPADVKSLMEFKKLRDQLYARDYARGAKGRASNVRKGKDREFGPQNLFDNNLDSYWAADDNVNTPSVEIQLRGKSTFDVVRVREQIRLGQRVEGWAVDAWLNGDWKEVLVGKSIGHQAMLKLAEPVTTDRVRLRITNSPACPTISEFSLLLQPGNVAAPQIMRNKAGYIMIRGAQGSEVRFTVDGKEPGPRSRKFTKPFALTRGGVVKAIAIEKGAVSSVISEEFGVAKAKFQPVSDAKGALAVDQNNDTFWEGTEPLVINLNNNIPIKAFTYLPRQDGKLTNMTDKYRFEVSADGENWTVAAEGEFGNLKANPIQQKVEFETPQQARFIRFTSLGAIEGEAGSVAEIGIIL